MYLFLSIPNYCGSTLIHNILETSPNVTSLELWFREKNPHAVKGLTEGGYRTAGFPYMGPHSIESNMEHFFKNPDNYNWELINQEWEPGWIMSNPRAKIKLQKSPLDMLRLEMMDKHFKDVKWILMCRNPYAHIESLIRKASYNLDPEAQLDQIVFHAMRSLEINIENHHYLEGKCYTTTYEDFCAVPDKHADKLLEWLPELIMLDVSGEFMVKGKVGVIENDNDVKIKALRDQPDLLKRINGFITQYPNYKYILKWWGYSLITD